MHVNVYGPMASGKTRNADALRRHYRCNKIIDEGKVNGPLSVPSEGASLILTIDPIRTDNVLTVHIAQALREIGVA